MLGTPVPPLMDSLSSENSPDPLPRLPGSRGIWCESEEERLVRPPENSLEAASELETVFADSDPATQKHASIATQALREGLYDKAVASIMNLFVDPASSWRGETDRRLVFSKFVRS